MFSSNKNFFIFLSLFSPAIPISCRSGLGALIDLTFISRLLSSFHWLMILWQGCDRAAECQPPAVGAAGTPTRCSRAWGWRLQRLEGAMLPSRCSRMRLTAWGGCTEEEEKSRVQREAPGGKNTGRQSQRGPRTSSITCGRKLSPCSWPEESESLAQHEPCFQLKCQLSRFERSPSNWNFQPRKQSPSIRQEVITPDIPSRPVPMEDYLFRQHSEERDGRLPSGTRADDKNRRERGSALCTSELAHQHRVSCPYFNSLIP